MLVVIVLVTRLSRNDWKACSENAYWKKLLVTERTNKASKGSTNKASRIALGRMNSQFKCVSFKELAKKRFRRFIDLKSRGIKSPATCFHEPGYWAGENPHFCKTACPSGEST